MNREQFSSVHDSLLCVVAWPKGSKACLIIVSPENINQSSQQQGAEKLRMAFVSVNNNESIESALRRFKRKVMTEEIIKDLKKHAHFIPPGQKAKLKSAMARKRNKKRNRMRPINRD